MHAETLARLTQEVYATVLDRYIVPRLGSLRIREIRPQVVERFKRDLATSGVGTASARKTLTVLQGILQRAVEWERIPSNPAAVVRDFGSAAAAAWETAALVSPPCQL